MSGSRRLTIASTVAGTDADPKRAAGVLEGYVDADAGDWLSGWVWDRRRPNEAIAIEVYVDGRRAAAATADLYRPDLEAAGKGNGRRVVCLGRSRHGLASTPVRGEDTPRRLPVAAVAGLPERRRSAPGGGAAGRRRSENRARRRTRAHHRPFPRHASRGDSGRRW